MSSDELATCAESDDVDSLMQAMRTEKVRRIPIVDERGSLVGIVAQADVVRKAHDDRTRRANRRAHLRARRTSRDVVDGDRRRLGVD